MSKSKRLKTQGTSFAESILLGIGHENKGNGQELRAQWKWVKADLVGVAKNTGTPPSCKDADRFLRCIEEVQLLHMSSAESTASIQDVWVIGHKLC